MKKLIPMMFAAMFLCNISYGASISDLLNKSIKLSCVIENSSELILKTSKEGRKNYYAGDVHYIKIDNIDDGEAEFYVDNNKRDGWAEVNDEFILYNGGYPNWTDTNFKINRKNGIIQIYGSLFTGERINENRTIIVKNGSCEKATENKF